MDWFCSIVLILVGVFCLIAGIKNWDWFFNSNYKMRNLVKMLGRSGARALYIICGAVAIIIAVALMFI